MTCGQCVIIYNDTYYIRMIFTVTADSETDFINKAEHHQLNNKSIKNRSMTSYISILRGINVNGRNTIKMEALKNVYSQLSFKNIQTYIQSGNVVFQSTENDPKKLESIITLAIEKEFNAQVPVLVLTAAALEEIINANPFLKNKEIDPLFLHVTFLIGHPIIIDKESIIAKKHVNEDIIFTPAAIYLYCPNGYGKTKLTNTFIESRLKIKTTTRNWKTTNELLKLAKNSL